MSAFATASDRPDRPARRSVIALGAATAAASLLSACVKPSKPLRVIVAGAPGSATDNIARLFGRHVTRLFGDKVEVENEPRAIGKVAMQRLFKDDRSQETIGFLQNGILYSALVDKSFGWDLNALGWVGSFNTEHRVLVNAPAIQVERFEALFNRQKPLILISGAVGASGYFESRILGHLTPAKVRVVPGFNGAARNLALISGEGEGAVGSLDSLTTVLEMPGSRLLLRLNDLPLDPASAAHGWSAPPLAAFAGGPDKDLLLDLISAHARLGRIAALPPGTSPAVLARWRQRFQTVVADPAFLKEAAAQNLLIAPVAGERISDDLRGLLSDRSTAVRAALTRALA
jgi:tripartite-type tricarboxylate transporter receptor subunit TctC